MTEKDSPVTLTKTEVKLDLKRLKSSDLILEIAKKKQEANRNK